MNTVPSGNILRTGILRDGKQGNHMIKPFVFYCRHVWDYLVHVLAIAGL